MSLVGKSEIDIEIKAPAAEFHEVISGRPHHISNVSPAHIQSCEIHEDGVPETAKEIIEAIDNEKNSTTFKVIEGHLLEKYKNFHIVVQATPKGEGSLVHWTFTYEKLHENIPQPQGIVQLALGMTKDIDAHLTEQKA
ncbi:hypothetical protein Pint_22314 [Pistacia integerrima]|uniref:Uncharacterized protein n=1 Tax=Pistacia integerrima TaxID=434235 RepID=A0ACC0YKX2_9ROSI|nr:hypothetical protein Pint_22314 [Pistacia integerrima]